MRAATRIVIVLLSLCALAGCAPPADNEPTEIHSSCWTEYDLVSCAIRDAASGHR